MQLDTFLSNKPNIFRETRSDACRMRQNLPSILAWPLFYLHVLIHDYEALISSKTRLSWEINVKREREL